MPAGTIALTNNSATVNGTGTSFTTELKVGDFIGVIVGSAPYTLIVGAITSDTQLTLSVPFNGPTSSGQAWYSVPASLKIAITQQVLNDMGTVARGMILDKANWQKIFSSDQSVTVTRPDLSTFTGPSWGYMANQFGSKLDKAQNLNDVASKDAAWTNIAKYGTTAGTAAQGNDGRLNTVDNKTGGTVTGNLLVSGTGGNGNVRATSGVHAANNYTATLTGTSMGWDSSNGISTFQNNKGGGLGGYLFRLINADNTSELYRFQFRNDGVGLAPGGWVTGSDERIKTDIKEIDPEYALNAVLSLRHVTFKMRDKPDGEGGWITGSHSAGYLAQELEQYLPEVVSTDSGYTYSCRGDDDEIVNIKDMKNIDPGKASAALNGAAIKALHALISKQDAIIAELQKRMKSIDGLDE